MKSDVFLSEVVEKREIGAGAVLEVCATAEGRFDRAASVLTLVLDAYVQNVAGEQHRPVWLPRGETLREHGPREEIHDLAREIFHRWTKKVREAVPRVLPDEPARKPS